jgi:hypothetical protein
LYATHVENSEIQVPEVKDCGKLRLTYANDHGHLRELVGHVRQFWGKTREKPWKQAERGIRNNERNHWRSPRKIPEIFYGDSCLFWGKCNLYSLSYAVILHKKIDGLNMKRCRLILLVSFVGCFCCVVSTVQYLTSYKTNSRCLDCIYTTKFSHLFLLQK